MKKCHKVCSHYTRMCSIMQLCFLCHVHIINHLNGIITEELAYCYRDALKDLTTHSLVFTSSKVALELVEGTFCCNSAIMH